MPCDQVITTKCDLKHPNAKILFEALKKLGLEPRVVSDTHIDFRNGSWRNGTPTIKSRYGQSVSAESIKQAYAKEVVGYAAKQFGWKLTQKATQKKGVIATFEARKR